MDGSLAVESRLPLPRYPYHHYVVPVAGVQTDFLHDALAVPGDTIDVTVVYTGNRFEVFACLAVKDLDTQAGWFRLRHPGPSCTAKGNSQSNYRQQAQYKPASPYRHVC